MLAKPQNKPGIVFLLLVLRPGPSASEKVFLSNHKLPASALQAARTAQPLMLMVPKRELASLTELALPLNRNGPSKSHLDYSWLPKHVFFHLHERLGEVVAKWGGHQLRRIPEYPTKAACEEDFSYLRKFGMILRFCFEGSTRRQQASHTQALRKGSNE